MSSQQQWDYSFDVVVVGSGNGGMTAALCSYEMGTRDVLVIEKSDLYGGTSSISGGGVWIPCNRYAVAAGSAALLAPGTQLCRPADVVRLVSDVKLSLVG